MALVRKFGQLEIERLQLHHEVEAKAKLFDDHGRYVLQISTYGRPDREIPGKVSQSIQLDEQGIAALRALIARVP